MKNPFGDLFKPIGPETATSKPSKSTYGYQAQHEGTPFPLNEFLLSVALAVPCALLVAAIGFQFNGPQNDLVGADLGNLLVTGVAATIGSFAGGLLAGGFARELVGPFSAVPIASMLLMGIWIAAGVTDSLLLLAGATFVPMGAGVAVGFAAVTGLRLLAERTKQNPG